MGSNGSLDYTFRATGLAPELLIELHCSNDHFRDYWNTLFSCMFVYLTEWMAMKHTMTVIVWWYVLFCVNVPTNHHLFCSANTYIKDIREIANNILELL
jgi:hypothetical protein